MHMSGLVNSTAIQNSLAPVNLEQSSTKNLKKKLLLEIASYLMVSDLAYGPNSKWSIQTAIWIAPLLAYISSRFCCVRNLKALPAPETHRPESFALFCCGSAWALVGWERACQARFSIYAQERTMHSHLIHHQPTDYLCIDLCTQSTRVV